MNDIKKWIPNILTLGNLMCGMLACLTAAVQSGIFMGEFISTDYNCVFNATHYNCLLVPSLFIFGAAILDFLDGLAARLLKVHSELGKQLDSLADMVSFGVAPSFIIFSYNIMGEYSYMGLFIGIFACIRLAKFNIDTRQSDSFLGLPVPSVGIIIASLPFIDKNGLLAFMRDPWFVAGLVVLLCILMVCELPLLALKFKNYSLKDNFYSYLVLLIGLISILIFHFQGLPLVILGYVLVSLISRKKVKG